MKKYADTLSVRLAKDDWWNYGKLLSRFGTDFRMTKSERFRVLLRCLVSALDSSGRDKGLFLEEEEIGEEEEDTGDESELTDVLIKT